MLWDMFQVYRISKECLGEDHIVTKLAEKKSVGAFERGSTQSDRGTQTRYGNREGL